MKLNKQAITNLEQNRCVSTSLKDYTTDMIGLTYHAGVVLAAMNSYGMYDRIYDSDCQVSDSVKELFQKICLAINDTLLKRCRGMEYQMGCGKLDVLRNEIIVQAQKAEQDEELLDQYVSLMEILNPAYAAFLVSCQAGKAEKDIVPCQKLLALINEASARGSWENIEDMAIPFLMAMEGLQEHYYQPLYRYQLAYPDVHDGFAEVIEKKGFSVQFSLLDKTSKLLSSSSFAEL